MGVLRNRDRDQTERRASTRIWLGLGGFAIPVLILGVTLAATLSSMRAHSAIESAEPEVTIKVIGHQWWWEIQYQSDEPQRMLTTANEIRIPAGQPVRIELESRDVIHSFWVPNLQLKTDLVPGRSTVTWIHADEPGVFRGQCAEFCGLQHTNMAFFVVALEPDDYDAWFEAQLEPAAEPQTELEIAGREVFMEHACSVCHAIRGTPAFATMGPDLTHLASRVSLAAGTLPNTRGHLAGWISDPQGIKPGNQMPNVDLEAHELLALVAYLEILQ